MPRRCTCMAPCATADPPPRPPDPGPPHRVQHAGRILRPHHALLRGQSHALGTMRMRTAARAGATPPAACAGPQAVQARLQARLDDIQYATCLLCMGGMGADCSSACTSQAALTDHACAPHVPSSGSQAASPVRGSMGRPPGPCSVTRCGGRPKVGCNAGGINGRLAVVLRIRGWQLCNLSLLMRIRDSGMCLAAAEDPCPRPFDPCSAVA